jgi:hypothetical protein
LKRPGSFVSSGGKCASRISRLETGDETPISILCITVACGWAFSPCRHREQCLTDLTLEGDADGLPDWWEERWSSIVNRVSEEMPTRRHEKRREFAAEPPRWTPSLLVLYGSTGRRNQTFIGNAQREKKAYTICIRKT